MKKIETYNIEDLKDILNADIEIFNDNEIVQIVKIVDIIEVDEDGTTNDDGYNEAAKITLDTDTNISKDVRNGDYLYITALMKTNSKKSLNNSRMCVLKVRVVEIYKDLNILKRI